MPIPIEPGQTTWPARLTIDFSADNANRSKTLLSNHHEGPLRIQKALYPEGSSPCHAIIVHPPGGIAGGDQLEITLAVQQQASAVLTTPGAAKWYGSGSIQANQAINMKVCGDLEWLPHEAIIFNQALGNSLIQVNLAPQSRMIGWDGLAGNPAVSTLWAALREGDQWTEEEQNELRIQCPELAWSALSPRLLVGRQRGPGRLLQAARIKAWSRLRPRVLNRPALSLRIWAT